MIKFKQKWYTVLLTAPDKEPIVVGSFTSLILSRQIGEAAFGQTQDRLLTTEIHEMDVEIYESKEDYDREKRKGLFEKAVEKLTEKEYKAIYDELEEQFRKEIEDD